MRHRRDSHGSGAATTRKAYAGSHTPTPLLGGKKRLEELAVLRDVTARSRSREKKRVNTSRAVAAARQAGLQARAGMSNIRYTRSCTYEIARRKPAGPLLGVQMQQAGSLALQILSVRGLRREPARMAPFPPVWGKQANTTGQR
jgi:hypothetical protein